jgi:hypothetical protein
MPGSVEVLQNSVNEILEKTLGPSSAISNSRDPGSCKWQGMMKKNL